MSCILYKRHVVKVFNLLFTVTGFHIVSLKASVQSSDLTGSNVSTVTYVPNQNADAEKEYLFSMDDDDDEQPRERKQPLTPPPPSPPTKETEYLFAMEEDDPVQDNEVPIVERKGMMTVPQNNTPVPEAPKRRQDGSLSLQEFSLSPVVATMLQQGSSSKR